MKAFSIFFVIVLVCGIFFLLANGIYRLENPKLVMFEHQLEKSNTKQVNGLIFDSKKIENIVFEAINLVPTKVPKVTPTPTKKIENSPSPAGPSSTVMPTTQPTLTPTPTLSPTPTPSPVVQIVRADPNDPMVWEKLAQCESGGNWSINTGNGYYGGLQFSLGSWQSVGGSGLPSESSREEQIAKGKMLQARRGWGAWGLCAVRLGL